MAQPWIVTDGANPRIPGNQLIEIQTNGRKKHRLHAHRVNWRHVKRYRIIVMNKG